LHFSVPQDCAACTVTDHGVQRQNAAVPGVDRCKNFSLTSNRDMPLATASVEDIAHDLRLSPEQ
jgi:hypothetical protein